MPAVNDIIARILDLFHWWTVIAPWERAIRVRHGKKINVLGPGLHFRIPGIDRFFVQAIRKRYMNTPTQTVTTKDGKAITISGGTSYCISDISILYDTLSDADDVVQVETMSFVAQFITSHSLDECQPDKIQEFVNSHLSFDKYGLGQISFLVTDFVAVKTYRIINSNPKDYGTSLPLSTTVEKVL